MGEQEVGAGSPEGFPSYPAPQRPEQPMRAPRSATPWVVSVILLLGFLVVAVPLGFAVYALILLSEG